MRAVVLDNEAVQALKDALHPKHRAVLAHLEGIVARRRRAAVVEAYVPTAVRVEAHWDRSAAAAAPINRFPVKDHALGSAAADLAAAIAARTGTSVADSHVGATVRALEADEIVVLGSDPDDMEAVCEPVQIRAVRL